MTNLYELKETDTIQKIQNQYPNQELMVLTEQDFTRVMPMPGDGTIPVRLVTELNQYLKQGADMILLESEHSSNIGKLERDLMQKKAAQAVSRQLF